MGFLLTMVIFRDPSIATLMVSHGESHGEIRRGSSQRLPWHCLGDPCGSFLSRRVPCWLVDGWWDFMEVHGQFMQLWPFISYKYL